MLARRTVEEAREEARHLRLEAEDYVDQRLALFEIVLERTMKTVAAGRRKLSGAPADEGQALGDDTAGGPLSGSGPAAGAGGARPSAATSTAAGGQGAGGPARGRQGGQPGRVPDAGRVPGRAGGVFPPGQAGQEVDERLFDQDSLG